MPVETAVGEFIVDDDTVCAEGDNEMLFAFHNTLDNSLVPGEGGEETLSPDEAKCSGNGTWDGTACACADGWIGDDCSTSCVLKGRDGNCYSCDSTEIVRIDDSADCRVCDGVTETKRYISFQNGKTCVLGNDCPDGSTPDDSTGYCECPNGQFFTLGFSNTCVTCEDAFDDDHISVLEDKVDEICSMCGLDVTDYYAPNKQAIDGSLICVNLDEAKCSGHGTWNGCGCDCDTGWCGSGCSTGY